MLGKQAKPVRGRRRWRRGWGESGSLGAPPMETWSGPQHMDTWVPPASGSPLSTLRAAPAAPGRWAVSPHAPHSLAGALPIHAAQPAPVFTAQRRPATSWSSFQPHGRAQTERERDHQHSPPTCLPATLREVLEGRGVSPTSPPSLRTLGAWAPNPTPTHILVATPCRSRFRSPFTHEAGR